MSIEANYRPWTFATDARADERLINALAEFGLHESAPKANIAPDAPEHELRAWISLAEQGFEALFTAQVGGLEPFDGIVRENVEITGSDGNCICLQVHYQADRAAEVPAALHIHGGGMTMLSTFNPTYQYFRDAIASRGMLVVGVEFRNAGGALGPHPFPAGLNDVYRALEWLRLKKDELGVRSITLAGESGGACLAISCSLQAVLNQQHDFVDGIYAMCPMLFDPREAYPVGVCSHEEYADYFIGQDILQICANAYDPMGTESANPLCWPTQAQHDVIKALPPYVISVNELDPLRDEGLEFDRRLRAAGVDGHFRVVSGTCHSGDCNFPRAVSDIFSTTIDDIARFAFSHKSKGA